MTKKLDAISDSAVTKADNEQAVGLDRPTLVERLVSLVPLPYGWAVLLVAAVLGPPGSLFAAYLETGDLGVSLQAYFYDYMPAESWQRGLAIALWYALYIILLWSVFYIRRKVLGARQSLVALLPDSEAFERAFGPLARLAPALLIGLAVELFFVADYRGRLMAAPGPFSLIYEALSGPPLYLMVGTALWVYARSVWGLYTLGNGPLILSAFYEEKYMGMRPLARLSLQLSRPYFVLLSVMVLMPFIAPVSLEFVITVGALILLGIVFFFLPLIGAHLRMKREKEALKAAVRERWKIMLAESFSPTASAPPDAGTILGLEALERKVAAVRTWPFDLPILGKLGAMAMTVLLALTTQLIKSLLGF